MVLSNGSMVENRFGLVLAKFTLPESVTRRVIKICDRKHSNLVMYIDDYIIVKEMNVDIYQIYEPVAAEVIEVGSWEKVFNRIADVNKCLVVEMIKYQNLIELEEIFRQEVGQFADILFTSRHLLEVLPKGITKVTGIQKLIENMGITMKDVMVFGDYDNDVEMLQQAGLGVVVANGSEAARENADLIIEACDENGPAKFLDALINKN
jgi:Cof subfamily protein (haloacid dehalogenase superfamily)